MIGRPAIQDPSIKAVNRSNGTALACNLNVLVRPFMADISASTLVKFTAEPAHCCWSSSRYLRPAVCIVRLPEFVLAFDSTRRAETHMAVRTGLARLGPIRSHAVEFSG